MSPYNEDQLFLENVGVRVLCRESRRFTHLTRAPADSSWTLREDEDQDDKGFQRNTTSTHTLDIVPRLQKWHVVKDIVGFFLQHAERTPRPIDTPPQRNLRRQSFEKSFARHCNLVFVCSGLFLYHNQHTTFLRCIMKKHLVLNIGPVLPAAMMVLSEKPRAISFSDSLILHYTSIDLT